MLRQGTITQLDQHSITILLDKAATCDSCHNGAGCGAGLFGLLFSSRSRLRLSREFVPLLANSNPGQRVSLDIPSSVVLKMAFTGYCLPVVAMILFAVFCQYFVSLKPVHIAACGLAGLMAGLVGGVFAYSGAANTIIAGPGCNTRIIRVQPDPGECAGS